MREIIDVKNQLHDKEIQNIIAYSQYMPSPEKLHRIADEYASNRSIHVFGCSEDRVVHGIIVIEETGVNSFEIIGIAVNPDHRMCGIGRELIAYAIRELNCKNLFAETDDDAVNFYRRCGFTIKNLGQKYKGVTRYSCSLIK